MGRGRGREREGEDKRRGAREEGREGKRYYLSAH